MQADPLHSRFPKNPRRGKTGTRPAYIILGFSNSAWMIMEAEQLNIVANRLVDLAQRATELRRYL